MSSHNPSNAIKAQQDFERARRSADLKLILARFTGRPVGLLSYEDVRQRLKAHGKVSRGLHEIPLDSIVGSVGRYSDFTRDFLPLQDASENRWVQVKIAVDEPAGVPHIEVYKISDTYFVLDGNHRVSVARQMGFKSIQANVIEVKTPVPLTPDLKPDDLIVKAEYADFLDKFQINQFLPNADLSITAPGGYRILEEHIEVHRYFMGVEQEKYISPEEAWRHWYETVYLPVAHTIRERGILREFPKRTETDLYLWIAQHRADLEREFGWEISPHAAASDLADQYSLQRDRFIARLGEKFINVIIPEEFEKGPPPGEWRRHKVSNQDEGLFADLLLPMRTENESWNAFEQALIIANREKSRLHGLHVVESEKDIDKPDVLHLTQNFNRSCQEAGVVGSMVVTTGRISHQICNRARWADLLVVSLRHPPPSKPTAKLSSGFGNLVRRCPRPILAVPENRTDLKHSLLAYDGSPKAQEALFLSAYLVSKWGCQLTIITVLEKGKVDSSILSQAQEYLEKLGIQANYIEGHGRVVNTILDTAQATSSEFIIMGGYGHNPLIEIVLGSSVDQLLRECSRPMLICR